MLTRQVGLKKSQLSENDLKALWCALDADDSNGMPFPEFLRFIKKYTVSLLVGFQRDSATPCPDEASC